MSFVDVPKLCAVESCCVYVESFCVSMASFGVSFVRRAMLPCPRAPEFSPVIWYASLVVPCACVVRCACDCAIVLGCVVVWSPIVSPNQGGWGPVESPTQDQNRQPFYTKTRTHVERTNPEPHAPPRVLSLCVCAICKGVSLPHLLSRKGGLGVFGLRALEAQLWV